MAGRAAAGRTVLLRPGPGPALAALPVGAVTAGLGGVVTAVAAGGVEAGLMPGAAGPDRAGGRTAAGGRGPAGGLGIIPAMKSDIVQGHHAMSGVVPCKERESQVMLNRSVTAGPYAVVWPTLPQPDNVPCRIVFH